MTARSVTIPIRFGMVTVGTACFYLSGLAKRLAMRPAS